MNIKRIIIWAIFIIVIGLIVWGMIAASKKANKLDNSLPLPDQILSTDWSIGNALAKVNIVEYSDFQCPACAMYFPIVEKLVSENINDIRFIYRHFPLPQHQNAIPAAQSAEAAGKQGKFWDMYRMIFSTHDEWENLANATTVFRGYAEKLGLDMNKYDADINLKEIKDKIDADLKGGAKAGINSTPSFYINGKKIKNPESYEAFKKIIDEAIKNTIK